jgi:hypothetical protein
MIAPASMARRGELRAPKGWFRVVGVDTFEGPLADYHIGDFSDREDAIQHDRRARKKR